MEKSQLASYACMLRSLAVFRGILEDKTISAFLTLLCEPSADNYGKFLNLLYYHTDNFSEYLLEAVSETENPFMLRLAAMEEVPECVEKAAKEELFSLQKISGITSGTVKSAMGDDGKSALADWKNSYIDFQAAYAERMSALSSKGCGIFAKFHTFNLKDGKLVPIKNPDPQKLSELTGYELERGRIINNTLALLCGKPAANALLYGDAGTGKSSTVKAIANEYKNIGLRLIELRRSQLGELPEVMEMIAKNPLKFIIFVDDISLSADDENFSCLKAILEGSVSAKTPNAVIYATSNRRHIVKERFSDREDEIHAGDTMEETISLSERFGLKAAFLKPNKEAYFKIVEKLAKEYNIPCTPELLDSAEAFALRRSGRSGRAAKHFIESVCCGGTR